MKFHLDNHNEYFWVPNRCRVRKLHGHWKFREVQIGMLLGIGVVVGNMGAINKRGSRDRGWKRALGLDLGWNRVLACGYKLNVELEYGWWWDISVNQINVMTVITELCVENFQKFNGSGATSIWDSKSNKTLMSIINNKSRYKWEEKILTLLSSINIGRRVRSRMLGGICTGFVYPMDFNTGRTKCPSGLRNSVLIHFFLNETQNGVGVMNPSDQWDSGIRDRRSYEIKYGNSFSREAQAW